MSQAPIRPEVVLYSRAGCDPCGEAREALQWALEERATQGEVVPTMREVDIDASPDLQERYGALVPVVAIGESVLLLVTSGRQLRAFLAATLPRQV